MVMIVPFVLHHVVSGRSRAWFDQFCDFTHAETWQDMHDGSSTCSYALQVLQQSIFACRVAADDSLKGLIALDVVGDAL